MARKFSKATRQEKMDIDYWSKLSPDEVAYMNQFLLEYYQGDFNFEIPLHPKEKRLDCYSRNNSARRQFDAIGSDLQQEAIAKAFSKAPAGHYTPLDYVPAYEEIEAQWDDGLDPYLDGLDDLDDPPKPPQD